MPSTRSNARSTALLVLALGCGTLPGCANYQLQVPETNPANQLHEQTTVIYLWGVLDEPRQIATECDITNALDTIRVRDNLAFDLVSVLTIGLIKPLTISYRCSAGAADVGSLED